MSFLTLVTSVFLGLHGVFFYGVYGQSGNTGDLPIAILEEQSSSSSSITFGYRLHGSVTRVSSLKVTVVDQRAQDNSKEYTLDIRGSSHTVDELRPSTQYSFLPQTILKSGNSVQGKTIFIKTKAVVVPDEDKKDSEASGLEIGTIVGIVVGCLIGAVLLVAAFIIGFKCTKRKEKKVEYRACDNKHYTVPGEEDQVQIEAEWKDEAELIARDPASASLPPEAKRRLQFDSKRNEREAAPLTQKPTEGATAQHQETVAVSSAPAGYRRSYADADIIPRGPSLKYRESLREVTRDKYRNRRKPDAVPEDDLSDDDGWYQNASVHNGKSYPQHSYPAPKPHGYARPAPPEYQPEPATRAAAAEDRSKGRGKRLPAAPPQEQGPPGYSELQATNFRTKITQRYGEDESAL